MFAYRKNKIIRAQLDEFLGVTQDCLKAFSVSIEYLLAHGIDNRFVELVRDTHKKESRADDIRRQTEVGMYEKSLLPESREDILRLLEITDRIPNRAESILNQIVTQGMLLPEFLHEDIRKVMALSLETFELLVTAAHDTLEKMPAVLEQCKAIDRNESECDKLEQKMITTLFKSDMPATDKILAKEIILQLGGITDGCEDVADFLTIFRIKRRV